MFKAEDLSSLAAAKEVKESSEDATDKITQIDSSQRTEAETINASPDMTIFTDKIIPKELVEPEDMMQTFRQTPDRTIRPDKIAPIDSFDLLEAELMEKVATHDNTGKMIVPMDSFERIEAEIMQEAVEASSGSAAGFTEDYRSMGEETNFDQQIASARGLRKQSNLDELTALDLQWKMEHQQELADKALQRLEVAALIKKAEQTLLPQEFPPETSKTFEGEQLQELARESEQLSPELVMLDKIMYTPDLMGIESSDLSEEEGFRLRLSCIMEESESDTSGSGVFKTIRSTAAPMRVTEPVRKELETENVGHKQNEDENEDKINKNHDIIDENKSVESTDPQPVKPESLFAKKADIVQKEYVLDERQAAFTEKQTSVVAEECSRADANENDSDLIADKMPGNRLTEENLSKLTDLQGEDEAEQIDSVGSSSPEPNFGIQRLKSGTKIDKFSTKPKKRLESSSDSSLDLSTTTTSPSVEDASKSFETIKAGIKTKEHADETVSYEPSEDGEKMAGNQTEPQTPDSDVHGASGSSRDISIHTCSAQEISKSATPENVKIETDNSRETSVRKNSGYDIREITDEEVQAMFPKVARRTRGRSEEQEPRQRSDSQSVKSFDILGAAARVRSWFPRVRKSRRGASLESGMADKKRQELKRQRMGGQSDPGPQEEKSESCEPPPVPPETYLWEELRRWRMKGGYPWTHLDKPPFDEKTWKNQKDHEYEPINPPPQESNPVTNENIEGNQARDVDFNEAHFLRIPRDDELVVSPEDMEVEAIGAARQFQDELEDRFLATSMTTTTASRTDCDVNTSMLDSSGLEDLPLKRDSRTKKALQSKTEQMRAQAQGLQQRIRSQAGKLRNKLRSLPRPTFPKKQDRARSETEEKEKSRFRQPERPKCNLPDRPKFKMPQKPKIILQSLTKPLRDRTAQARSSNDQKKNIFDLDFKSYPRMFNKKSKDRGEYATSSPKMARSATPPPAPMQPSRKKGPVGQRWVNRFDDIRYADDRASEMSQRSGRSDRSESLSGFHERDFAITDDFENTRLPPPRAISTKSSISRASENDIPSSRSSVDRIGKGVLEEIDSDQFFLRQKGISENDINMEKYLSEEIREAFRTPVVNALRQLDLDYEEEKPVSEFSKTQEKENIPEEPLKPSRTRSLKRVPKVASQEEPIIQHNSVSEDREASNARYENFPEKIASAKPRYSNLDEDNVSEYYKSPPEPEEYHHYKVPRPTPVKRKSSSSEKGSSKKKQNGWVEVAIETELEEIPLEETPQTLPRRKSKKSQPRRSSQDTLSTFQKDEEPEPEPDYIIPAEAPPEAPKRGRSISKGARSIHSMARDPDTETPIPPKRTSSKSIHKVGLSQEAYHTEPDNRSVHSLAFDDRKGVVAPKRIKSLSQGSRSIQSLPYGDIEATIKQSPLPPERTRSLSRASHASRSYHSFADDEKSWAPEAPERTRSLSRKSVGKTGKTVVQVNHYEANSENGYADYAVVEKVKPPRPPAPSRRRKESRSPAFNTFPRRSPSGPMRPVRNYATLGPSRPPRKTRPMATAKSLEHIYSSDQMSQSFTQAENALELPKVDDIHGSNKDLQATDVVEKMKARPLPAPPRPPRLKTKSEEASQSMEIVEEVCVSTQTDPLPDDVCLEDDIIQEFSHEQLKIQEAFLQEMREEEERIQREIEAKRARHLDVTVEREENEAKMEIIRQMDDIIREERRLLDDDRRAADRLSPEIKKSQLEVFDDDMGYASLDRRQTRSDDEPQPSTSFQQPRQRKESSYEEVEQPPERPVRISQVASALSTQSSEIPIIAQVSQNVETVARVTLPTPEEVHIQQAQSVSQPPIYIPLVPEIVSTERLRVGELEVDRLTVRQLDATGLSVQDFKAQSIDSQEVRGALLQVQDVNSNSGSLTVRSIELPPEFIQQLIARIPWEELRPTASTAPADAAASAVPAAPQPSPKPPADDEPVLSSHSSQTGAGRRRRRHVRQSDSYRNQGSSDEEIEQLHVTQRRGAVRVVVATEPANESTIGQLSQQLARACTAASVRAMEDFAQRVRPPPAGEARTRYVRAVLLVALIAIAGYILLGLGGNDVHHHHWDFQFPPQPPRQ